MAEYKYVRCKTDNVSRVNELADEMTLKKYLVFDAIIDYVVEKIEKQEVDFVFEGKKFKIREVKDGQ